MSWPLRTAAASASTLLFACLLKVSASPLCRYGAPQQRAPSTTEQAVAHPGSARDLTGGVAHRVGSQHEPREVDVPVTLPGDIRAVHVAELALEALVVDLVLLGLGQIGGPMVVTVVVVAVDSGEERREGAAELGAQLAAVAKVEDPGELLTNRGLVEVPRVFRVVRRGHGPQP